MKNEASPNRSTTDITDGVSGISIAGDGNSEAVPQNDTRGNRAGNNDAAPNIISTGDCGGVSMLGTVAGSVVA